MSEQLSERGKSLVEYMPQAVNALADLLMARLEERLLYGEERAMTGYIKRSDAFAALAKAYHLRIDTQLQALGEALSRVPDADVVDVVRCKNCIHCREVDKLWEYFCDKDGVDVPKEHFCGYGEAK